MSLLFRLTSLVFKEECIVTACQDGYVCTWARPGTAGGGGPTPVGSVTTSNGVASPTHTNQVSCHDFQYI